MIAIKEQNPPVPKQILRWAGSKYNQEGIYKRVIELYAPHRHKLWIEPFCGSLGMTLRVLPDKAVLCDINTHLMLFWSWYAKHASTFEWERLPRIFTADHYYAYRKAYNENKDIPGANVSALLWWLNQTCFNGLMRCNVKGDFNVPMGRTSKGKHLNVVYPEMQQIKLFESISQQWRFYACDWAQTLEYATKQPSFVYLDPPYVDSFTTYAATGFSWYQQQKLAKVCSTLECPVVVSNKATTELIKLYEDHEFTVEIVSARRSIDATGRRLPEYEVIAHRNLKSDFYG